MPRKSVRKFLNISQCPRNTQALTTEKSDFLQTVNEQCTLLISIEGVQATETNNNPSL